MKQQYLGRRQYLVMPMGNNCQGKPVWTSTTACTGATDTTEVLFVSVCSTFDLKDRDYSRRFDGRIELGSISDELDKLMPLNIAPWFGETSQSPRKRNLTLKRSI